MCLGVEFFPRVKFLSILKTDFNQTAYCNEAWVEVPKGRVHDYKKSTFHFSYMTQWRKNDVKSMF